jgi:uncharacterized OsmC-like protein
MTGTFGGALEARHVNASESRLVSESEGEIETEDGVLVVKRIHIRYRLRIDADADRAKIQRAFETHPPRCPVYRSISPQIEITTELELLDA